MILSEHNLTHAIIALIAFNNYNTTIPHFTNEIDFAYQIHHSLHRCAGTLYSVHGGGRGVDPPGIAEIGPVSPSASVIGPRAPGIPLFFLHSPCSSKYAHQVGYHKGL